MTKTTTQARKGQETGAYFNDFFEKHSWKDDERKKEKIKRPEHRNTPSSPTEKRIGHERSHIKHQIGRIQSDQWKITQPEH